jgi:ferredoxin
VNQGEIPAEELIDRDACMGSGNCLFWAPTVFDLDDEGVAIVRGDVAGSEDQVRTAAANCPTSAIRFERFFPTATP